MQPSAAIITIEVEETEKTEKAEIYSGSHCMKAQFPLRPPVQICARIKAADHHGHLQVRLGTVSEGVSLLSPIESLVMHDRPLILVEGMPGTGKSTVSQFIDLQLRANGRPSCWWHEERSAHPLRLYYEPERHPSWIDYIEEATALWQSFAKGFDGRNQIVVLDAALLQNHVRSMLIFNADRKAIYDLVSRIESLIDSLNPVFVYLKPRDIEENFRNVIQKRGERMLELWIAAHDQYPYTRRAQTSGFAGFIAFWKEFDEISDEIFKRLAIAKLRQDVSTTRVTDSHREIVDFLRLPSPSIHSCAVDLQPFVGNYACKHSAATELAVHAEAGYLVALVNHPTIDVQKGPIGCFRETRLIPTEKNRHYVESWPHEVNFCADRSGKIVGMQISTTSEGWDRSRVEFVKN